MIQVRKAINTRMQGGWGARRHPSVGSGLMLVLETLAHVLMVAGFGSMIWLACCSGLTL